jgi:hypothetical protein
MQRGPALSRAFSPPTSPLAWQTVETLGVGASVRGISVGGEQILYSTAAGYYVYDQVAQHSRRVDVFADGSPLPNDIVSAAISGDGSTVAFIRVPTGTGRPAIRVVHLDTPDNWESPLPYAGHQVWQSGWDEQCSFLTWRGPLHVSDDGSVAWFTTEPCYYDKVLALDISSPTLRWSFGLGNRHYTQEVSADGHKFSMGWDFCHDTNWDGYCNANEPVHYGLYSWPIVYDNPTDPQAISHSWNWQYPICGELPEGSIGHLEAGRMYLSTAAVGLDPDTIVYNAGRQLYWAGTDCHFHSLGNTGALDPDDIRVSSDGRSVAESVDEGGFTDTALIRTRIGGTGPRKFIGTGLGTADPLLSTVARAHGSYDPGTNAPLGSSLQVAPLDDLPTALKVAVLGDSYISGEGTFSYEPGTDVHGSNGTKNLCHRSYASWAYQLGARLAVYRLNGPHPRLKSFACSGATTWNIEHGQYTETTSQIERLAEFDADGGRSVDIVFAGAGGNDAGFTDIIMACLAMNCLNDRWKARRLDDVYDAASNVEKMLERIKLAAPHATVFLTGYPSIVDPPEGKCQDLGLTKAERAVLTLSPYTRNLETAASGFRIDEHEQEWLNAVLIPTLNADLRKAAIEAGVHWIDPTGWFAGHGVCDSYAFGNGLAPGDDLPGAKPFLGNESFHPNPFGYGEMETRIEFKFGAEFKPNNNPAPAPQGIQHEIPVNTLGAMVVDGDVRTWGDSGHVTVQRLPDGTRVVLGMYSAPTLLGEATAGPDGTVDITFEVPRGLYPGLHTLIAYDAETGEALGSQLVAVDPPQSCLTTSGDIDLDGDALADRCDASLTDGPVSDSDGDGVANMDDDCPANADADQLDANDNGIGDACDPSLGATPVGELEPFPDPVIPRPKPLVTLTSQPPPLSNSESASLAFSLTSAETQPAPTLTASCSVDGNPSAPCTSPLELSGLDDGDHRVTIMSASSTGATSDVVAAHWWVDTQAPTAAIGTPYIAPRGFAQFTFTTADWDAHGRPSYVCSLDQAPFTPCTSPTTFQHLAPGNHNFSVRAVDAAGNEGDAASTSWAVDSWATDSPPSEDGSWVELPPSSSEDYWIPEDPADTPKASKRLRIRLRPKRFRVVRRGRGGAIVLIQSAVRGLATVVVQRRTKKSWHIVGQLRRRTRPGSTRFRFSGRLSGRSLRPGQYRFAAALQGGPTVRCRFVVKRSRR